ncbi:SDR family NAD(P)-dependent oxidoreductase [Mycobacterium sp.]|uniref:SDR family NAD(P)-dependent oxidoreductase n=1 Tax=Mycobacterium sp. TaxID=1785 RepID=UPI002D1AA03A|nr:SDR family NAD(P)-dependent oxidoreductase [Mycobacterium sp.]HXB85257.1 SDR family NAD(P)-dependent oxidoreductase [Mycobacterium sp.]
MTGPRQPPSWSGLGVVVTGGAAGIGLSLGRVAAARGAAVVLADIEKGVAEKAAASLRADGGDVRAAYCDVTDYGSVEATFAEAAERLGGINVLCANAGVGSLGSIDELTVSEFSWIMQVNLFGVFHAIRAAVPHLKLRVSTGQRAHVLVTGSENSLGLPQNVPAATAYQTSKTALLGLTDCVRRDLAPASIGVTLLCPSHVATEVWNARRNRPDDFGGPEQGDPAVREEMHRIGQDPDEVAALALDGVDANAAIVATRSVSNACAEVRARQVRDAFDRLAALQQEPAEQ